jgi:hypothetical protein
MEHDPMAHESRIIDMQESMRSGRREGAPGGAR